jgi:hypothetical protein
VASRQPRRLGAQSARGAPVRRGPDGGSRLSIRAIAWVLDHPEPRGTDRLVLIAIANHANAETGLSRPGRRRIAAEAAIAQSTASRSVARLVARGDLVVVDAGGGKRATTYRFSPTFSGPPYEDRYGPSRGPSREDRENSSSGPPDPVSGPPGRIETVPIQVQNRGQNRNPPNGVGPALPTGDARAIRADLIAVEPDLDAGRSALANARRAIGRP